MTVSEEMVERGMRALHEASTYRGYNQETLDREWSRMEGVYRLQVTAILTAALSDQVVVPRPLSEWHEDMGPMLWWCWEPPKAFERIAERVVSSAHNGQWLGEAPYCGAPLDTDWPDYHTHFTPIPVPAAPPREVESE